LYLWRYNVAATLACHIHAYIVQTRQTIGGLGAMARKKKIKLEEKAIREILVADTAWELCAEASDLED
jgi:hypothetical protein